ncbi:hypothetical protein WJX72_006861 [[Myrmecia] bisecta]|uniref:Uncharacterized protein n=1 Tax=[Myrmecia] bisecta TaxID=41462 RepID=A0AAW1P5A9_9CHLO
MDPHLAGPQRSLLSPAARVTGQYLLSQQAQGFSSLHSAARRRGIHMEAFIDRLPEVDQAAKHRLKDWVVHEKFGSKLANDADDCFKEALTRNLPASHGGFVSGKEYAPQMNNPARQAGKSTDALAVCRRMRDAGFQVAYMDLLPLAKRAQRHQANHADSIWQAVLLKFDIDRAPQESAWRTLQKFLRRDGKPVVLVFDNSDAMRDPTVPDLFADWLVGVRSLAQGSGQETRMTGQLLVGTPRLPAAVLGALDGDKWSKLITMGARAPTSFSPNETAALIEQIATVRCGELREPADEWARSIWSDTEGAKGLTGMCLKQLDDNYFRRRAVYRLADWGASLRSRLLGTAYQRLVGAIDNTDPGMQSVIEDLLGTAAMTRVAHASIADSLNLPPPSADASPRDIGEYVWEHALSQFDYIGLQQPKVLSTSGWQVMEYSYQHELSRGVHLVLRSAAALRALNLKLAVEPSSPRRPSL